MTLPDGLYDLLLTEGLARSLADIDASNADVLALKGGATEFLADVITRQLSTILDDVSGDDADKAKRQLELVNDLLVTQPAAQRQHRFEREPSTHGKRQSTQRPLKTTS
jgi:hypothetical protein